MSTRAHGRAQVSPSKPKAFGVCDRCGFLYNLRDLSFQFDYAGIGLLNYRILVCEPCYDTPQQQKRPVILPADPLPVANARVESYEQNETNWRTTQGTGDNAYLQDQLRITQDGNLRTTQPSQWQSFTIATSSGTGTVATVTYLNSYVVSVGATVTITGMVPNLYNGSFTVTASSAGSVSFNSVATGTLLVAGTIIVPALQGTL
jgi:hypothetical protein